MLNIGKKKKKKIFAVFLVSARSLYASTVFIASPFSCLQHIEES